MFRAFVRKEMTELYLKAGSARTGFYANLAVGALISAGFPLFMHFIMREFGANPSGAFLQLMTASVYQIGFVGFFAGVGVLSVGIDAFAGERERHTLPNLLATPLTDGQLLWGKGMAIAAGPVLVSLAAGFAFAIAVTAIHGLGGLVAGIMILLASPVISALTSISFLGITLAISAKAATVKAGQQTMVYVMMPLILVPTLGTTGLPILAETWSPWVAIAVVVVLGFGLAVGLAAGWLMAVLRCRRPYLMGARGKAARGP